MVLRRASSLYVKQIELSDRSIDKVNASNDTDLITATVLATAEQINTTVQLTILLEAETAIKH